MKKTGIVSLVGKTLVVYNICAPDESHVQQRRELSPINMTCRKLISTGYGEGYSHEEPRGDLGKE